MMNLKKALEMQQASIEKGKADSERWPEQIERFDRLLLLKEEAEANGEEFDMYEYMFRTLTEELHKREG